jgi:hypothetical protein
MMRKKISILVVLIALFTLMACATGPSKKEIHESWLGAHKSQLIKSWGPPNRYASDGKGGEILIYEKSRTTGAIISGTYFETTNVKFSEFYVNENGYIYYYRYGTR